MEVPIYSNSREDIELIETFLWDPEKGAPDIDFHIERMCKSAENLRFKFEIREIRDQVFKINSENRLRCRLTLSFSGETNLSTSILNPTPSLDLTPFRVNFELI